MIKKNPNADLRSYHPIFVKLGIICSLLFMIAATNMNLKGEKERVLAPIPQPEPINIVVIPPTKEPVKPAPQRPSVFIVVPESDPIDPDPIEFLDIELGGNIVSLPPLPDKPEDETIEFAQFMPEMKGGISKLYKEIEYPKAAKIVGIEGKVFVEFIVNKKGEVENPKIIRGIGGGCDEEVLRAMKLMTFTPGIQNGAFVNVRMRQMVTFKLKN